MLPGPYERWFTELAGRASPVESRSTCDACAMLPGAPDLPPAGPFLVDTRCCTFHPVLAPHFVGGILGAGSDAARERVRARIARRAGVSPLGLGPPPEYLARQAAHPENFGRSRELLCPFHEAGRCSIWAHRGTACAAYHCKLDRGALGQGLWNLIVVAFNIVERALARRLLEKTGLDAGACDALLHSPDDIELDVRAWGAWHGREEAYFLQAARLVEPLGWADVVAVGGRELAGLGLALRGAVERFAALAPPDKVRSGANVLHHIGRPGRVGLQNLTVPDDLLEVPAEVAARIADLGDFARLTDLGLEDALVKRLLDWQILVPVA